MNPHHGSTTAPAASHTNGPAKKAGALLIPAAAFAMACWAVYVGGLASLQQSCFSRDGSGEFVDGTLNLGPIDGFSAYLQGCNNVFQFWWWIMALEFVLIVALVATSGAGKGYLGRHTFMGLFAVACLLYILASHVFLLTMSIQYFHGGNLIHRARATIAGAIMTAIANFVLIMILGHPGHSDGEYDPAHHKQNMYQSAAMPATVQHV